MAVVLGSLRLPPATFWALTMPELDALLRGALGIVGSDTAPSRNGLSALMARFPDRTCTRST
jgi:uncharacterized phage protein (TIGR02216 family)